MNEELNKLSKETDKGNIRFKVIPEEQKDCKEKHHKCSMKEQREREEVVQENLVRGMAEKKKSATSGKILGEKVLDKVQRKTHKMNIVKDFFIKLDNTGKLFEEFEDADDVMRLSQYEEGKIYIKVEDENTNSN